MKTQIVKKLAVLAVTLATAVSVTSAFAQAPQGEQAPSAPVAQSAQPSQAGNDMAQHCDSMMQHMKLGQMPMTEASPQSWHAAQLTGSGASVGLTRAQVRAELVQAEEAGVIPVHSPDYPPSARTIERNRVRFALAEHAWKTHAEVNAQ
jgi:Domain of unknown function (DUF4148)